MVEDSSINLDSIKKHLYELYLDIKFNLISSEQEIPNNTEIISSSEPILIITAIQAYINHIKNNKELNTVSQLEKMVMKLEKDLRFHIKSEFMFRIQKDSLDTKIKHFMEMEEEFEELKQKVRYQGGKFLNNDRKDNEIKILRRENSNIKGEVKKMEIIIKNLEKKNYENKEIIDQLRTKIYKNDIKIEEMEKELEVLKNKKNLVIDNHEPNNFFLKIKDRNNLSRININSIGNNKLGTRLKRELTNYQWPLNQVNYETAKSNNNQKTFDNNSKLIIHTFSKVNTRNHKNIIAPIAPLRNIKLKDEYKYKNSSISMRSDENKKFELIGKFIHNNSHKYISNNKIRNLTKDNNIKYGLTNLPSSNSNVNIRHTKKEEKIFHEYSGLNKPV